MRRGASRRAPAARVVVCPPCRSSCARRATPIVDNDPRMRSLATRCSLGAFALALSSLAACGAKETPPHHPVGEMRARLEAKLDLVALAVKDPDRAARGR